MLTHSLHILTNSQCVGICLCILAFTIGVLNGVGNTYRQLRGVLAENTIS